MHRNCIFFLTLIGDVFSFFYCKRRFVQTNVTKLPLTKLSTHLLFPEGNYFLNSSFNINYTAGFLLLCWTTRDETEEISLKGFASPSLTLFLNSTQNALLCVKRVSVNTTPPLMDSAPTFDPQRIRVSVSMTAWPPFGQQRQ